MANTNTQDQCRLCLTTSSCDKYKYIFSLEDCGKVSLATKIMICTSLVVTINDKMPQYLCRKCNEHIESFFDFRKKCFESYFNMCKILEGENSSSKEFEGNEQHLEIKQETESIHEEDCLNTEVPPETLNFQNNLLDDINFINCNQPPNEQNMECANCLNKFSSIEDLNEHWKTCGVKNIKEEVWHAELRKLNPANEETNTPFPDVPKNKRSNNHQEVNKCKECEKLFKYDKLFTEHLLIRHIKDKRFVCFECDKSFIDHYELKYHMRIHLKIDKYRCKVCEKIFPRPSSLRRHLTVHSRVKPYKCKYCLKIFTNSSNLLKHERTHTGENLIQCKFCCKSFYDNSAKLKHEKNHVKSNKMFQCDICNRMFATHKEMDEHFNLHDSQMIWKCKTCKQVFRKPSALKSHSLKIHNDKSPFVCEICSDSFAMRFELKAHINVHTD
uniref:Protein krueppel n=2 Tax=Clastoptera arizonana TaxID=38151 RepID=A0A1B6C082_9HEMI